MQWRLVGHDSRRHTLIPPSSGLRVGVGGEGGGVAGDPTSENVENFNALFCHKNKERCFKHM